jgi:hypothetical protein
MVFLRCENNYVCFYAPKSTTAYNLITISEFNCRRCTMATMEDRALRDEQPLLRSLLRMDDLHQGNAGETDNCSR